MKCICTDCKGKSSTSKCFKDHWIFENFIEDQMNQLQTIGRKRTIPSGSPVFMQGTPANEMFLIKSGRIKLNKLNEDGSEITLDFRKAGDIIGEDAFSDDMDYPLSAWAVEETVTCGFELPDFNTLVQKHPEIGLNVIRSMSAKMSSMTGRLGSMAENSLEDRLYSVLSNVATEHGTCVSDGFTIDFPLTHEELGFLVGAHRVSITKAMKALTDCGKITKTGRKLTISRTL